MSYVRINQLAQTLEINLKAKCLKIWVFINFLATEAYQNSCALKMIVFFQDCFKSCVQEPENSDHHIKGNKLNLSLWWQDFIEHHYTSVLRSSCRCRGPWTNYSNKEVWFLHPSSVIQENSAWLEFHCGAVFVSGHKCFDQNLCNGSLCSYDIQN